MSDYSTLAVMLQETKEREDALLLMDDTCRSRFFLQPHPSSVCLFFHGFTAVPYQFEPIGKVFFQAGYNVLIPLLPGHGLAGDWNRDNPPPLPEERQVYEQFGLEWLQFALALGGKVIVGGLSGGSTLAAWLALERPQQVDRALVFAPYLSDSNKLVDLFVRVFNIYFEWKTKPGRAHFGYPGFLMPALRLFLDMGADILDRAHKSPSAPMLIVSSESDRAVGNKEHEALFEAVRQFQPKSWYHRFARSLDIPHTMMTKAEGDNYLELLIAIARAYVESDLTWAEVEEICDRMRHGEGFNMAVDKLNLKQRVSTDLSTLCTMVVDNLLH